jgi:heme/copper-type cytochrome/quinol oxidase subunit 2
VRVVSEQAFTAWVEQAKKQSEREVAPAGVAVAAGQ